MESRLAAALSYTVLTMQTQVRGFSGCIILMIFMPKYKGGCDVKSRKRCLYYYYIILHTLSNVIGALRTADRFERIHESISHLPCPLLNISMSLEGNQRLL